jgi:hypothetical protein
MDSPVLPHDPQGAANERNSRYAQSPQVSWRLLALAALHSQSECRVGSVFVPFPPLPPTEPCVECEMFLRRQEALDSVSKKEQHSEDVRPRCDSILSASADRCPISLDIVMKDR